MYLIKLCNLTQLYFQNKVVEVDDAKVKLQVWDTAGQERFRSVTHAYYRDAHGEKTGRSRRDSLELMMQSGAHGAKGWQSPENRLSR